MKNIFAIFLLFLSINLFAATSLGKGANFSEVTPISKVMESPQSYIGKELTLSGMITEVCEAKGCWMNLASDKKFQTMKIKVEDGKIIIPLTARGKKAAAKGKLQEIKMDREKTIKYLAHQAEEQKKPFDPNSVKENITLYQLFADGVSIE